MKIKLKKLLALGLDIFFPQKCIGCGKFGSHLCPKCQEKIRVINIFGCPKCNQITKNGKFCPRHRVKSNLTGVMVATRYNIGPTKELIHRFKYDGLKEILPILGDLLIERLNKSAIRGKAILVPVPLHFWRKNQRGFNQSELLANYVGEKTGTKVETILIRKRNTKAQASLKGKDRLHNLDQAFALKSNMNLKDKTIILVDDVSTTGSTLEECAKVLRKAGARQIWGLVVAK